MAGSELGSSTPKSLTGLLQRFVADGLLDMPVAQAAASEAEKNKKPIVTHLVEKKLLDPSVIATTASNDFGLPLLDLASFDTNLIPSKLLNEKLVNQHHVLPLLARAGRLYIAMSDPTNVQALSEFQFQTGISTQAVLVEEHKLSRLIENSLNAKHSEALGNLDDEDLESIDLSNNDNGADEATESEAEDAPIVRFVNKLLLDAIHKGASDIHFEPYERLFRVRFRIDGILYEIANPPVTLAPRIAARIKIISNLDISERRVPQDGHFKMSLSRNRHIDFRVSSCPTTAGEKIVIRVVDGNATALGIDALGFEDAQRTAFNAAITKPQGMILVTGPTGSGKTVTLYTALDILNVCEKNISTVEDPVELNVPGINQVNVNTKAGLTFSTALRSFLRQDPDIIMLGEIRDLETAEIAIKASHTGHLVLSTLHTNSAAETVTRLMNMGAESFDIASSVNLIIAQRLARRLCKHCKVEDDLPENVKCSLGFKAEEVNELTLFRANPEGCEHCTQGYAGRVGIYETMVIDEEIGQAIMNQMNSLDLAKLACKKGMSSLRQSGLNKVRAGITSMEEINRVTKD